MEGLSSYLEHTGATVAYIEDPEGYAAMIRLGLGLGVLYSKDPEGYAAMIRLGLGLGVLYRGS